MYVDLTKEQTSTRDRRGRCSLVRALPVRGSHRAVDVNPLDFCMAWYQSRFMTALALILLVVGLVLLLLGVFVEAAKFLLWVGIVIVVLAIIAFLFRYIRRGT